MLSAISRLPRGPARLHDDVPREGGGHGKDRTSGGLGEGLGEGLHGRDRDLEEETTEFASRMDFQTICYKLSAAMIEVKPEDPVVFALNFLRKLKKV